MTFYSHYESAAADVPVKFQSDWKSLKPNLAASRLCEILQKNVHSLVNRVKNVLSISKYGYINNNE